MLSGEGIMAMPAAPGTPVGENAIPCARCGTILDVAGLPVGMSMRCGRCAGVFPRPTAAQLAAALGQHSYAPPSLPTFNATPAPAPPPPQMTPQQVQQTKSLEGSGDFELSLKESVSCPGCGKEYYEEDLPPPDDAGKIRCKRCKKVMKDTAAEEDEPEEDEEEEEEEEAPQAKGRKPLLQGKRGGGAGRAPQKKAPAKKAPPKEEEGPKTVILDEKFKTDFFNAMRAGDEERARRRCLELVSGREVQAKQIFDHLHGIAKKKGWIGTAPKTAPTPGPQAARPGPAPNPRPAAPAPSGWSPGSSGYAAPLPYAQPVLPPGVEAELPPGLIEVTPIITPAPAPVPAPQPAPMSAPTVMIAPPGATPPRQAAPQPPPPPPKDPNADPEERGFLTRVALEGRIAQLELLVAARRFGAARELAQAVLAAEPRLARAHALLAEALAGLGDDEAALESALKGARLEPDSPDQVRTAAQALARKGRLAEAVNALRRIVGPKKGEAKDAVLLADFVRRLGDEAQARNIMNEVLARDPQSLEPVRQAVVARTQARDLDGAAAELESLVQKEKPPRPLGLACALELARVVEASFDKASPRAILACARALDACGKTIPAVKLLAPLVVRDPQSVDARRALGLAYARLGAAPLAEEHLRAVAGRGSAGADEFRALGELALERGDTDGAARVLVRARDLRPDDPSIRRALARAFEAAGELSKAVEELEAGLATAPNDKELTALHESVSQKSVKALVSSLEARVRENPDDAQAQLDLGAALFEKGEASRAFESLARAARDPYLVPRVVELVEFVIEELDEPRPAVVLLKELHVKSRDLQHAIETLERYLRDHTDDVLRLELLDLYAEGQRVAAAVEGLLAFFPKANKDRLPAAIALAQKILEREPMQHDLARALARAQRRNGEFEAAARSLERYVQSEMADREARVELAQNLEEAGKVEAAFEALRPLVDTGEPSTDELSYAAALLARLDRPADAVPILRRAAAKKPDDRSLKERLERAEGALRDREAARLQADLDQNRASEEDRRKLAGLLAEAGKKAETLAILRSLPGAPQGDPESVFLRFAAEQFTRRGRIEKAEAALRQLCTVLAYPPGSEQEKAMLYRIGALYERGGDRRSARRAYLELVARDAHYRDAYAKLEAQEDATVVESTDASEERRFAELVETEASRDVKTLFDSLGAIDLSLDPALLADARAAATALSPSGEEVIRDADLDF
jgi:Flp pilus assembly protein TadD